jgi:hypothetical protein
MLCTCILVRSSEVGFQSFASRVIPLGKYAICFVSGTSRNAALVCLSLAYPRWISSVVRLSSSLSFVMYHGAMFDPTRWPVRSCCLCQILSSRKCLQDALLSVMMRLPKKCSSPPFSGAEVVFGGRGTNGKPKIRHNLSP